MGLLDVYENMVNAQVGTEKVAEEKVQATEAVDERMEVLEKYAALADDLLADTYGTDYEKEDVTKLASLLIDHDIKVQEDMEKVAELQEAGIIMARAFKTELAV